MDDCLKSWTGVIVSRGDDDPQASVVLGFEQSSAFGEKGFDAGLELASEGFERDTK
jgi:hypothetical protein